MPAPIQVVFEKEKLPRRGPIDRRYRYTRGAHVMQVVEVAVLKAYESPADLLIWVVAPGNGIGGGPTESAHGSDSSNFVTEVAAVDCAQTRCPGKIQPSDADDVGRIRALVGEADRVGAVDEVRQRLRVRYRNICGARVQITAPEPGKITVSATTLG